MFSIVLPERPLRSPRSATQPGLKNHPRGLADQNAAVWLNGLSIAHGNPQLGFELMNGEKRFPAPERSRCGHLIAVSLTLSRRPYPKRTTPPQAVASGKFGAKSCKNAQHLWITQ
jgi:hypothetical protein